MLRSLPTLAGVASGLRFVMGLRSFLRDPVTVDEALSTLRHRLGHREDDFLALAREAIYDYPQSPYLPLLRMAGCEPGDLERLVHGEGLEEALRALYRQGVYLTVAECRGQPVVRGSLTLPFEPAHLQSPFQGQYVEARRPGTRSQGRTARIDLATCRERGMNRILHLYARDGFGWSQGLLTVPGSYALMTLLEYAAAGEPFARWFSPVDPEAPGLDPQYRWSGRLLHWSGLAAGVRIPAAAYVPMADMTPAVRWMERVLRAVGTPHIHTTVSLGVRLCEAAAAAGIEIAGAQFSVSGEPATPQRMAAFHRAGVEAVPSYGSTETGNIARGCLAPQQADEMHFMADAQAFIQVGGQDSRGGLPAGALLFSSLRATAPLILLNVSIGDAAVVSQRPCGCPLEQLGWTAHLHTIRSFEKLTAGGMTFLDTDVVRVLEEQLPARFGGGPTDYQLVETESEGGGSRIRLVVHPRLGPMDEPGVADAFLEAIGRGTGAERVAELMWRGAGLLTVVREPPRVTESGKILHLLSERPTPSLTAAR